MEKIHGWVHIRKDYDGMERHTFYPANADVSFEGCKRVYPATLIYDSSFEVGKEK